MAELAAAASGAGDQGDERRAKVRRIRRLLDEAEDRRSVRGMTVGSKTLVEKMRRSQWKKRAPRDSVRSVQVASL